jgi:hypothetical protein
MGWKDLARELDAWAAEERLATFWWRDDDAIEPTPALDALLRLAERSGTPVALAVIPHDATPALATRLDGQTGVEVLQHGYAHTNQAPAGEKKIELGPHRRADHVIAELATGQDRLERLFGSQFLPVMVPPWNRIAPFLVPMLPEMKYLGLSTFAPRTRAEPVAGFRQANTHVDVIDWRGSRGFVGADAALAGVVSHHLVQDGDSWRFVEELFAHISGHAAGKIVSAGDIFGSPA